MSSLTLTLRADLDQQRMDLHGIVPDRVLPLSVGDLAKLPISVSGRACPLAEVFEISDGQRDRLVLRGALASADRVGGGMREGLLIVESSVGHRLADRMSGGELCVCGDAGHYASAQQRGGLVTISGNVGDFCAAAPPNSRRGMQGGQCLVEGSAGQFLAYRMRRGTVVIGGNVAEGCAASMVAGTVVLFGEFPFPLAVGMRRGTVIVVGADKPPMHVGFTPLESIELSYLPLLFDSLRTKLTADQMRLLTEAETYRALGDRASGGLGEVLWLAEQQQT
ncbi:MAG: formylmethanofuran dehydrogenase subunit C [Pirellulaceae bacterium]|nr:formylmethanofuran dehydrogenase subunit C [Pirellulaceae bacterium]